jgi:hypothetical protein
MTSRWYHPLECMNTVSNPLVVSLANLNGMDEWDLQTGRFFERWDESSWFRSGSPENDGDPDDVLQDHIGSLPIYSSRLQTALRAAGITGLQYLPVQVFRSDGKLIKGFAIANILDVIPALDLSRSEYPVYGDNWPDRKGEIRAIKRAVVRRDALEGYDIVRLKEYPLYICVSQRFKDTFEAGGFTGYAFKELEVS